MELNARAPAGPIENRWSDHRFHSKLVNPANRRKYRVIVVGSGLAGGAAAATFGEMGYNVSCFCYQDSPRRAHSIAAQGGINAAKNYQNDGDSTYRLFYDTVKGGDFRARESNVYRLAELSVNIIDQCVAQGVPFAREYSGLLANRSFGGAQVARTFYARGQTGQQLLLGAYQALERQIDAGTVKMYPRTEMLDLIVIDGRARGIVTRDLVTGKVVGSRRRRRGAVLGRLRQRLLPVDQRQGLQRHRDLALAPARRTVREPLLHADPPDLHPAERRLPVQAHADERVAAQRRPRLGAQESSRLLAKIRRRSPSPSATTTSSACTRASATSCRATSRRAAPRTCATRVAASVPRSRACVAASIWISATPIKRLGRKVVAERYDNLFQMYERITGENPYDVPMRMYPAIHYTMGGLWVDYDLQSTDARPVRRRRSQLLRPRRQPPGRQRADAGLGRRLLHLAGHGLATTWPRRRRARSTRITPPCSQTRERGRRAHQPAAVDQGQAHARLVPPRAGRAGLGSVRHGPHRGRPQAGAGEDPGVARGILEQPDACPARARS